MSEHGKKIDGAKTGAQKFIPTAEEKAQYEVFKNGSLSRNQIADWLRSDLEAVASFAHVVRTDVSVFERLVDALYDRYEKLHTKINKEDGKEVAN